MSHWCGGGGGGGGKGGGWDVHVCVCIPGSWYCLDGRAQICLLSGGGSHHPGALVCVFVCMCVCVSASLHIFMGEREGGNAALVHALFSIQNAFWTAL